MSVLRAKAIGVTTDNADIEAEVINELANVLQGLEYEVKAGVQEQLSAMLNVAIPLAQLLAEQRAVFSIFEPTMEEEGKRVKKDDELRCDFAAFRDEEEGGEGDVWFLVRPALLRYGTWRGESLEQRTVLRKALVQLH